MITRAQFSQQHQEIIAETVNTLKKTIEYHLTEYGYYHSDIKTNRSFGVDIAAIAQVKNELENAGWSCDIQLNHNIQQLVVRVF